MIPSGSGGRHGGMSVLHVPSTHECAPQLVPQDPQLAGSVDRSTQWSAQTTEQPASGLSTGAFALHWMMAQASPKEERRTP